MSEFNWIVPVPEQALSLELIERDGCLVRMTFRRGVPDTVTPAPTSLLEEAGKQLTAYLAGRLTTFDLSIRLHGTPFQEAVWYALKQIPYGETVSYGELAKLCSRPAAARAVGNAVGKNPIPIIVPCHRVVASGGKLGGFTGGTDIKRWLLAVEGLQFT